MTPLVAAVLISPGLFFHRQRAIKSTKLEFYDYFFLSLSFGLISATVICHIKRTTVRETHYAKHCGDFASRWRQSGVISTEPLTQGPILFFDFAFLWAEGIKMAA